MSATSGKWNPQPWSSVWVGSSDQQIKIGQWLLYLMCARVTCPIWAVWPQNILLSFISLPSSWSVFPSEMKNVWICNMNWSGDFHQPYLRPSKYVSTEIFQESEVDAVLYNQCPKSYQCHLSQWRMLMSSNFWLSMLDPMALGVDGAYWSEITPDASNIRKLHQSCVSLPQGVILTADDLMFVLYK